MQKSFLSCLIILFGGKNPRIGIAELGICTFCKVVNPSVQKLSGKLSHFASSSNLRNTCFPHPLPATQVSKIFQPSVHTARKAHHTPCFVLTLGLEWWSEALGQGRNGPDRASLPGHTTWSCLSPALLFQGRK